MASVASLNANDNGRLYILSTGDFITVSLVETSGTGYIWVNNPVNSGYMNPGTGTIYLLGENFTPARQMPGSNGVKVITYQAGTPGQAAIHINLVAPGGTVTDRLAYYFFINSTTYQV